MSDVCQRALAKMCFTLGLGGLLTFKDTLAVMQRGAYVITAAGMLNSQWAKEVRITNHLLARAMESGVMPVADGIA
jgi:lysozyme